MPEYDCMGNIKISVDETIDEIEIKGIYSNELLSQEELKLESFKIKDPSKCEIKSKRKRVIKTRKCDDGNKLPKKLRNGWK